MELNGARSNPRLQLELPRLSVLHEELLRKAAATSLVPRSVPLGRPAVLTTVTQVLEEEDRPMRIREIQQATEQLIGHKLRGTSVKAALAAGAALDPPRFRRIRCGTYVADTQNC